MNVKKPSLQINFLCLKQIVYPKEMCHHRLNKTNITHQQMIMVTLNL